MSAEIQLRILALVAPRLLHAVAVCYNYVLGGGSLTVCPLFFGC